MVLENETQMQPSGKAVDCQVACPETGKVGRFFEVMSTGAPFLQPLAGGLEASKISVDSGGLSSLKQPSIFFEQKRPNVCRLDVFFGMLVLTHSHQGARNSWGGSHKLDSPLGVGDKAGN